MFSRSMFSATAALLFVAPVVAQTYSSCNPLYTTSCPEDTAVGKSINVDFTQGAVNSFTPTGSPTYDSNGVSFTVAESGDAPQLTSIFYIMFGKVEITMKAAPGAGIVSSLVLESDDLDEIDMEWLGADDTEVQTNYFGKGETTTYNRGAFNPAANNQGEFVTYTVEWTSSQIVWSVGSSVVRVLTPATANADQYPQTPMRVKFGAWSGGDPSNAPGTIAWARGPTNYADGPFTMVVQSIAVTDYSTGTAYKYSDASGNWTSIEAIGGSVNGNLGAAATTVATADVSSITSASPSIPPAFGGTSKDDTSTMTGWPWVAGATTLSTATSSYTSSAGIPSGWVITSSGKVVPANSAATLPASTPSSSAAPSYSPSSPPSPASPGLETITGWNNQGFAITYTEAASASTLPKSYNQQGFLISTVSSTTSTAGPAVSLAPAAMNLGDDVNLVSTSTLKASAAVETAHAWLALGLAALLL